MDENKNNNNEEDIQITSFKKIENSDQEVDLDEENTKEYHVDDLKSEERVEEIIEERYQLLPIATFKKVFKSDFDHKQKAVEYLKRIGQWIIAIVLGIFTYFKDTVLFYIHNNEVLGKIFRYPFTKHLGYVCLNSFMIAILPMAITAKVATMNSKMFKNISLVSSISQLGINTFIVIFASIVLLGFIIPLIEFFTNKHHIAYLSVIKAINVQGITLNPFIFLFLGIYLLGYKNKIAVLIACFILTYGIIASYFLLSKALRHYHLVRKDSVPYIMSMTFIYSLLAVLGTSIVYFMNSSFIQLVIKAILK